MKHYEWILFDADETLFHFDAYSGLQRLFTKYGMRFSKADFEDYQAVNLPLWTQYQQGLITAEELKCHRFDLYAKRLNVSANELSNGFLQTMGEISKPIEGAVNLLNTLKGRIKLGIITNGFTDVQEVRLQQTGFKDYIDLLVVSEEVGVAKPHPQIFEHALTNMGNPDREDVLMVGDNLESDIAGGMNAGLRTCWLNRHHKLPSTSIIPHYEVSSLQELEKKIRAVF